MELVSQYTSRDYRTIFFHIKDLWLHQKIKATPAMASLIEQRGINRHSYERIDTLNTESIQELYRNLLFIIIYAIDMQSFNDIQYAFDSEELIIEKLGR